MDFERLDAIAKELMLRRKAHVEREPGSIYYHGARVAKAVVFLRKKILPGDASGDDVLRAAAMFHDVGKGIEPHAHYGAVLARDILRNEATPGETEAICSLIEGHCDRQPGSGKYDDFHMLLQDADLLDHFGTYGIWMNFNYLAHHGLPISDSVSYFDETIDEYYKKHRALLNYEFSRRVSDDKERFEHEFIARMHVEATGLYYGFE